MIATEALWAIAPIIIVIVGAACYRAGYHTGVAAALDWKAGVRREPP